ncbi:hypothetical protein GCM10008090_17680 [Arenicella chitinivorans]|uniref:Uncharacterized protein n=1 Tax=Arenicella chitinivorans TaxID=1329800 RepID=A0A918VK98_9GAMM|nr:hypothetical protein [Arenicella chitinivorans]GHA08290.1 hypothetical protein GCM10008090_17680 [Arenicella chitinivorans]
MLALSSKIVRGWLEIAQHVGAVCGQRARASSVLLVGACVLMYSVSSHSQTYRVPPAGESEFDNKSDAYVKDWRTSVPKEDYEDTEFGELMYNEASTPTRLEVLRLLSKDTPSVLVFLTAVSMGLDIESVLQASVRYQPEKSRDMTASAIDILPLLPDSPDYVYSSYDLEDLDRAGPSDPYSAKEVAKRFFDGRDVLMPAPDWVDGQYHFLASAAELNELVDDSEGVRWYHSKSSIDVAKRPIFVSLYEGTQSILIDDEARVKSALRADPDALLPVVFVFNRVREFPADKLPDYPKTIKGIQRAYTERGLMLTPTPEWEKGEYHLYAKIDEFVEVFDIPEEEDFEPEAWQRLLTEAKEYSVPDTSFLAVIIGGDTGDDNENSALTYSEYHQYAQWDDPRTEADYPYVSAGSGDDDDERDQSDSGGISVKAIVGKGIILNRPDLIAALKALGVEEVPLAFYYVDNARVKPYVKRPQALVESVLGIRQPTGGSYGGGGGVSPPCASPPCTE